jgi:hypothetical protein
MLPHTSAMLVLCVSAKSARPMSALGHKRTLRRVHPMSALPPKADIHQGNRDVRFVPILLQKAAITDASSLPRGLN